MLLERLVTAGIDESVQRADLTRAGFQRVQRFIRSENASPLRKAKQSSDEREDGWTFPI